MEGYNEKFIAKNPLFVKVSDFADRLFHSLYYFIFVMLVSVLGFALGSEVVTMFILLFVVSLNLAICRDVSPSFLPTVLIALIPMQYANASLDGFLVMGYAAVFMVPALILRFVFFPFKFVKGKNLLPLIVYSVVLILGGTGSTISASQYFAVYPIYTVLGLGLLQVLMYLFWQSYTPQSSDSVIKYFCYMMSALALVAISMIFITYVKYYVSHPDAPLGFVHFLWKNYISDILMLTMPFAFYLSVKTRYKLLFSAFGLVQYIAVIMTQSGGGILFASLMMPFLLIFTLIKIEKKQRLILVSVIGTLCVAVIAFIIVKRDFFIGLFNEKIQSGGTGRFALYEHAIEVFKKFPVFGGGYGYTDSFIQENYVEKMDFIMTYFHSTFFQALAATGIVGLFGYAFMAFARLKTFIKKYTFNIFLLIGFLGYAGYSMVDVGTAMPFPFAAMVTFMLVLTEKYNAFRQLPSSSLSAKPEESTNPLNENKTN